MEIYWSIVSGFEAWKYAQLYFCHGDFSSVFRTLAYISDSSQDEKAGIQEESSNIETPGQSSSAYEEYYDDEQFDSEFESDEEFGVRKSKRRKTTRTKVFCFTSFLTQFTIAC